MAETFGMEAFASLDDALGAGRYDAAMICSPNHLHVRQASVLARAGCHLFVEKPLSLDLDEALSLEPVLKETGVSLMVGCNLRFHPGVKAMAQALESGRIGRPVYARAQFAHYLPNWRSAQDYRTTYSANRDQGGGILLDAIHEPDYLLWLLGQARSVRGEMLRLGDLEMDVEDTAVYVMEHESGARSEVHVDFLRRDKARGCELVGTEGTVAWSSTGKNPENVSVRLFDASTNRWEPLFERAEYDLNGQYVDELAYFLDMVGKGSEPMNGLPEAMRTMRLIEGVRQSSHHGGAAAL
jgi:predicted dehydrogenase